MGVQTEVPASRERRASPQDDSNGSVKRFKPSPLSSGDDNSNSSTSSLKIRLSRYPTPSGGPRAQEAKPRVTRGGSKESGDEGVKQERMEGVSVKMCEVRMSPLGFKLESDSEKSDIKPPSHQDIKISVNMTADEIISECERVGPGSGPISTSVLADQHKVLTPKKRSELPKLSKDQLLPPTPSVHVRSKQEAFSPQLLEWCLQRPITVIRGVAQACDIDLSLYTTKTLAQTNPNHPVEIRTQLEQNSDENWDPSLTEEVWYCTSSRSHTTVAKYAEYIATSFKDAKERLGDDFSINPKIEQNLDPVSGKPSRRTIKFGTNCDLSDERKWRLQIQELMKLPSWLRVVSAGNMLSHIGHQILGMNTIQLYLKVPGARTPGHQENNNFAAVNINIGPGDSEWFGVPDEYWGALQEQCELNKVDYLHGSWWPKLSDLMEFGIPTYRFMQRPGEVVWINTGCVHWVQAAGWCNNVAWNTGPLTHRQYVAAIERYEWNKTQRYQSIVAMVFLTWNMAQNIQVSDPDLYIAMKTTLMRSLQQSVLMKQFALKNDIPVRFHGHGPNEPVNYCMVCEEEVFNIFFVKEEQKKHVVHCLRCARQLSKDDFTNWICLEEYEMDHLKNIFDNFVLGGSIQQTQENPLKLSLVNNNDKNAAASVKTEVL